MENTQTATDLNRFITGGDAISACSSCLMISSVQEADLQQNAEAKIRNHQCNNGSIWLGCASIFSTMVSRI
jgi:hypothetical protein